MFMQKHVLFMFDYMNPFQKIKLSVVFGIRRIKYINVSCTNMLSDLLIMNTAPNVQFMVRTFFGFVVIQFPGADRQLKHYALKQNAQRC